MKRTYYKISVKIYFLRLNIPFNRLNFNSNNLFPKKNGKKTHSIEISYGRVYRIISEYKSSTFIVGKMSQIG